MRNYIFLIALFISLPLTAQTTFTFENHTSQRTIYFGNQFEGITHFTLHAVIGSWRPDYSLVAAVAIEMSDTVNGRFDVEDWGARLAGCFVGYILNRYLFGNKVKIRLII